jgi:hypothetical protein
VFYAAVIAVQILIFIRLISVVICALFSTATPLRAVEPAKSGRVALVIGNSRYEAAVGPLRNTVNDAKAMARTLRALGFTVIEEHNVTRDALIAALLRFRGKLPGAEVALFYFSGHGISVAGANYLVPVKSGYRPEAGDGSARRLLAETKLFNAEQAVAEMANASDGCNLVILDACRVTPVALNPANRDAANRGGLVEMNPPAGSLIAFATDAGRSASDGEGTNGLYTAELIRHLRTPGLTIEQVFKRTRAGVIARSGGAQIPAEYSRLVGEDIFLAGPIAPKDPEEEIPKGRPVFLPTFAEINQLAAKGDAELCIQALRQHARAGRSLNAARPLATMLEQVKETLRETSVTPSRAKTCLETCDLVLAAVNDCLAADHPQRAELTAKAHNRRGDALLQLGEPAQALEAFNAALALTPDDAYILFNRGVALARLARKDEARAEFTKVLRGNTKQPGARKLATQALDAME